MTKVQTGPKRLCYLKVSFIVDNTSLLGVGMFKRTILTEIILKVAKNAAIPDFLSSPSSCQLEIIGDLL